MPESLSLTFTLLVGVLEGAVLEVNEKGVTYRLQANSAVLHLLREAEGQQGSSSDGKDAEVWLEWEASQLQVCKLILFFFIHSVILSLHHYRLPISFFLILPLLLTTFSLQFFLSSSSSSSSVHFNIP